MRQCVAVSLILSLVQGSSSSSASSTSTTAASTSTSPAGTPKTSTATPPLEDSRSLPRLLPLPPSRLPPPPPPRDAQHGKAFTSLEKEEPRQQFIIAPPCPPKAKVEAAVSALAQSTDNGSGDAGSKHQENRESETSNGTAKDKASGQEYSARSEHFANSTSDDSVGNGQETVSMRLEVDEPPSEERIESEPTVRRDPTHSSSYLPPPRQTEATSKPVIKPLVPPPPVPPRAGRHTGFANPLNNQDSSLRRITKDARPPPPRVANKTGNRKNAELPQPENPLQHATRTASSPPSELVDRSQPLWLHQRRITIPTQANPLSQQRRPPSPHRSLPNPQYRQAGGRYDSSERGSPPQLYQTQAGSGTMQLIQRRPSPQELHARYLQQRSHARPLPAWKRVWRGIERGLDTLADLEDSVSDRASQLVNDVVKITPVKLPTASWIPPVRKLWNSNTKSSLAPLHDSLQRNNNKDYEEENDPESRMQFSVASGRSLASADGAPIPGGLESLANRKMAASRFESTAPINGQTPTSANDMDDKTEPSVTMNPYVIQYPQTSTDIDLTGRNTKRLIRANGGALDPAQTSSLPFAAKPENNKSFAVPQKGAEKSTTSSGTPLPVPSAASGIRQDSRAFLNSQANSPHLSSSSKRPTTTTFLNDSDDDDDGSQSLVGKLGRILPSLSRIPRFRFHLPGRGSSFSQDYSSAAMDIWADEDDEESSRGFLGIFSRSKATRPDTVHVAAHMRPRPKKGTSLPPPLDDLMDRCGRGKSSSLLNADDERQSIAVGRARAVLDIAQLMFFIFGARLVPDIGSLPLPKTPLDFLSTTIPFFLSALMDATDTWAPFAFATAFLVARTRDVLLDKRVQTLEKSIGASVHDETQYGSMFLRLFSSQPTSRMLPVRSEKAARAQLLAKIETARLKTFVSCILISLAIMTVSILRTLFVTIIQSLGNLAGLQEWRSWPPHWGELGGGMKGVVLDLGKSISQMITIELADVLDYPLRVAYHVSVFAALSTVALLPVLETKRKVQPVAEQDAEEEGEVHLKLTEQMTDLGSSGAIRLALLADDNTIESLLERWRLAIPLAAETKSGLSIASLSRLVLYGGLAGAILVFPLVVYGLVGITTFNARNNALLRWDSLCDVAIVLFFTHRIAWDTLSHVVRATDSKQHIVGFLRSLKMAVDERTTSLSSQTVDLQLQASISAITGLTVKDLWAAHATRRAWAVRGANLTCRNGEVLVILGEAGSGKTRLLTTLAESMIVPPRRARSTTRVRGNISFGSLDVTKWDPNQLKKRLGLFLTDVRTVSDTAQVVSGLTLEEILEPSDGLRVVDASHSPGVSERSCMMLALKLTGLYTTLLPRLPSKMSSVVTATEDDLRPSPLRPRYNVLSPTEWTKLLLSKVLAQAVYDNENSAGSNDKMENSLVGSILILDDVVCQLSEVDEARFVRDLRSTGAATLLTSPRWATGRFADRIAVVRDGAVVECGTHAELLNRGPQQSLYAAKWHAMTAQ